jgi:hypothetical protein
MGFGGESRGWKLMWTVSDGQSHRLESDDMSCTGGAWPALSAVGREYRNFKSGWRVG